MGQELLFVYRCIDLGDKKCDLCVLDQQGDLVKSFRLAMKAKELQEYLGGIGRSRVVIEAGAQSRWVAEMIEGCGHQVFVSNTRKVGYIHQSDAKNDPGDAYKLAELVYFRPELLHPIQHRSAAAQADLSWIRAREALVEARTQLVNTVRATVSIQTDLSGVFNTTIDTAVTVTSATSNSFTFTTVPGHVLYPATISFFAMNLGQGQVGFGIYVQGNFANTAAQIQYSLGGSQLEDQIWNHLLGTAKQDCIRSNNANGNG